MRLISIGGNIDALSSWPVIAAEHSLSPIFAPGGDVPPGLVPSLVERQMFDRPQRTTLTVRPGDDPRFVPGGLYSEDQTANLSVPELIRAILRLSRENDAWTGQDFVDISEP